MSSDAAHFFLRDLALILGTAALATVVFQRLRIPVIVGYLAAGIIVGPLTPKDLIHDPETIRTLAEMGVVLLMFSIGLEFRFRRLVTLGPRVALAAVFEVGLMLLLGYGVARAFGWSSLQSVLAAGVVAISSTMVVSRTLMDTAADRRFRDIVFGVLVMEDFAAIVLIAVLTTIAAGDAVSGPMLFRTLGQLALFLLALGVLGMLVVPRTINAVLALRRPETTLVASLGICFGIATLSVAAGYSVALGGFVAGMLVAESGRGRIVEGVIHSVRDLFAAIFFVAVGMLFDPADLLRAWPMAVAVLVLVIAGKMVGVTVGVFLAGYGTRDAVRAGMTLAQIGEFSFVIAGLGAARRLDTGPLAAVAVAVATVTAFTTPLLASRAGAFAAWLDRRLPHPVQTVASLYASWVELLVAPRQRTAAVQRRRWLVRFLLLDSAGVSGAIVGTSLALRHRAAWLAGWFGDGSGLRIAILATGAVIALPFAFGLVRSMRRLAALLSESAIPVPARGVDQGRSPRRTLTVTLEIILAVATGVPITLVTLPFVPPYGTAGVILGYLVILGLGFWRTAKDLDRHNRAGAELVVHMLAKQAHSGDTQTFEVVNVMLPGLGTIVPFEVGSGSEAAGATLGELNLRGRTGATVVALTRNGQRMPLPVATTRLEAGDLLALSGSGDAVAQAAALLRAKDTSSPPTATAATVPLGA